MAKAKNPYLKNPYNYVGGKHRLLPQILPLFPKNINIFYDIFCLSKDTLVFMENGIKTINELQIGDYIYDENCELKQVINKIKSPTKIGKKIIAKGNVIIKATDDHRFYNQENIEIKTKDLLNQSLLTGTSTNDSKIEYLDMTSYINISSGIGSFGGEILDNNKLKLHHVAPITNRFIPINKELMFCYGLVVAEGDKSNISIHQNELDIGKKFIEYYSNIIGVNLDTQKIFYPCKSGKGLQLAIPHKRIYEKIFFDAMCIDHGARNKNISFLFKIKDKELIKEALRSMYLGDGCLRVKTSGKKTKGRELDYKTSSKTLAYQLQAILAIKFGIKSTLSYGINKKRTISGRELPETDYYNISISRDSDIEEITGIKNDYPIRKQKSKGFRVTSLEDCEDEFYDITLEDNSTNRFIIQGGIVTHNCGGGDVFLNVQARNIIANDICSHLKAMNDEFKSNDIENILVKIQQYIDTYSLSKDGANAKENYLKFRKDWNNGILSDPVAFYTLLCYAFNNQIRFNNSGLYNMPAGTGRSHFNPSLKKKLIEYCNKIQSISIDFSALNFKDILLDNNEENFIYADPPYILSTATYNENGGWNLDKEKELLAYLEQANEKGIKFALSNLLETKGNRHPLLEAWVQKNNFIIHYLDMSYKNVSYNRDNTQKDVEVLITNY